MNIKKVHIDYRKVISMMVLLALLFVSYQAYQFKKSHSFDSIIINIDHKKGEKSLINRKDAMQEIRSIIGFDPEVGSIGDIDFKNLEMQLNANPYIDRAEVFVDGRLVIHVNIWQRKPISRVMAEDVDYYLAADGVRIPPSKLSTIRVPIISGAIRYLNGVEPEDIKFKTDFLNLIRTINEDDFLEALVDQINITQNKEIVFIPKLGTEKIIFGTLEDKEEKLKKLSDFYRYGTAEKGWNKYAYFDLSYKGQIAGGKKE